MDIRVNTCAICKFKIQVHCIFTYTQLLHYADIFYIWIIYERNDSNEINITFFAIDFLIQIQGDKHGTKIEIQIYKNKQKICIYVSDSQILQNILLKGQTIVYNLQFEEQDFCEDVQIQNIIKEQVYKIIHDTDISNPFQNPKSALDKYEEAFQLMRKQIISISRMIQCHLAMKDICEAVRQLTTGLCFDSEHPSLLLFKIKIINLLNSKYIQQAESINILVNIIKLIHNRFTQLSNNEHYQYNQIKQHIYHLQSKLSKHLNGISEKIYSKALNTFSQHLPIAKFFNNRSELQQELKRVFASEEQHIATPDQILDPISYTIIQKPRILPSGTSYDEKSLKSYFISQGYKDPITRKEINPNFLPSNNNLQNFIKNHPKLKQWQKYQQNFLQQ